MILVEQFVNIHCLNFVEGCIENQQKRQRCIGVATVGVKKFVGWGFSATNGALNGRARSKL